MDVFWGHFTFRPSKQDEGKQDNNKAFLGKFTIDETTIFYVYADSMMQFATSESINKQIEDDGYALIDGYVERVNKNGENLAPVTLLITSKYYADIRTDQANRYSYNNSILIWGDFDNNCKISTANATYSNNYISVFSHLMSLNLTEYLEHLNNIEIEQITFNSVDFKITAHTICKNYLIENICKNELRLKDDEIKKHDLNLSEPKLKGLDKALFRVNFEQKNVENKANIEIIDNYAGIILKYSHLFQIITDCIINCTSFKVDYKAKNTDKNTSNEIIHPYLLETGTSSNKYSRYKPEMTRDNFKTIIKNYFELLGYKDANNFNYWLEIDNVLLEDLHIKKHYTGSILAKIVYFRHLIESYYNDKHPQKKHHTLAYKYLTKNSKSLWLKVIKKLEYTNQNATNDDELIGYFFADMANKIKHKNKNINNYDYDLMMLVMQLLILLLKNIFLQSLKGIHKEYIENIIDEKAYYLFIGSSK